MIGGSFSSFTDMRSKRASRALEEAMTTTRVERKECIADASNARQPEWTDAGEVLRSVKDGWEVLN